MASMLTYIFYICTWKQQHFFIKGVYRKFMLKKKKYVLHEYKIYWPMIIDEEKIIQKEHLVSTDWNILGIKTPEPGFILQLFNKLLINT